MLQFAPGSPRITKLRKFTQNVHFLYRFLGAPSVKASKFHNLNKMPFIFSTDFLEDGDNIASVPF